MRKIICSVYFSVCLALPAVDYATLTPDSAQLGPSPVGTVATYNCATGFYIVGPLATSASLTCEGTATLPDWNPDEIPVCAQGNLKQYLKFYGFGSAWL